MLAILLGCVVASRADILLLDDFEYSEGPLVDVSANSWALHSPEGQRGLLVGEMGVALLSQIDSVTGEDAHRLLSRSINPLTDSVTTLYAGFTVNFSSLPIGEGTRSAVGSFFAHFRPGNLNEAFARVGANMEGVPAGDTSQFRLAVANEGWGADTTVEHPTPLHLNVSYRVVVGLDLAEDRTTLWIDPVDESSISVTATDPMSYDAGIISSFALRQGYTGLTFDYGTFGALSIDDLVVATRYSEVLVIPEPTVLTLLFLGLGVLHRSRRLSYL